MRTPAPLRSPLLAALLLAALLLAALAGSSSAAAASGAPAATTCNWGSYGGRGRYGGYGSHRNCAKAYRAYNPHKGDTFKAGLEVDKLPPGHVQFQIGDITYYEAQGTYYERRGSKFTVVPRPQGAEEALAQATAGEDVAAGNGRSRGGARAAPERNRRAPRRAPADRGPTVREARTVGVPVEVGGRVLHYLEGSFYDTVDGSRQIVAAPIGAVVPYLPEDHEDIEVDGKRFFLAGGVRYKSVVKNGSVAFKVMPPA